MILSEEYKKRLSELAGVDVENRITLVPADLDFAKKHWNDTFGNGKYSDDSFNSTMSYVNEKKSKSISVNDKIVGVYLLGDIGLPEMLENFDNYFSKSHGLTYELEDGINIENYKNKNGIYGIFIYILPEYRNKGIGKKLIEYGESIGDYIYGMHDYKLKNIDNWLKRRIFVGKTYNKGVFDGYITATKV